jgi:hypothetical protein
MRRPARGWWRLAAGLALLALASGVHIERRRFIASFFVRAPGALDAAALPLPAGPPPADPLGRAARVRVVLLDGLGLAAARALPGLSSLCRGGLDLEVDVGFPTVSLPVQSVLWSGLTQTQSGIEHVGARVAPPIAGLPARVPGSIAIAESHAFIVESFGFATSRPRPEEVAAPAARAAWEATGFLAAARAAIAGDAALAFVHVLRIDDAGHRAGAAAPAYAEAARWADRALVELHAAAPDARWLVLADHGHLPAGGHGGAEEALRVVRACVVDPALAAATTAPAARRRVHLVDLSRALADWLGQPPRDHALGRPLAVALAAPASDGATLPTPSRGRAAAAAALLLAALAVTLIVARGRLAWLPWWALVATVALVVLEGAPTLSTRTTYSPLGRAMIVGALPGLALLAIVAGLTTARAPVRLVVTQLALPLAALLAARVLCAGAPPLMPGWTAGASFLAVLVFSGASVVGLALLAGLVPSWFDRSRAPGSRPAPP